MEEISVKGEIYVKTSILAKKLGYTSDYIGQLCRAGAVNAQLVGRSWYVSEESLRQHKKNRYRSNLASTKKEIRKTNPTKDPIRAAFANPEYTRKVVNYENDEAELLPRLEKGVESPAEYEKALKNLEKAKKSSGQKKSDHGTGSNVPKIKVIKESNFKQSERKSYISPNVRQLSAEQRTVVSRSELRREKPNNKRFSKHFLTVIMAVSLVLVAASLIVANQVEITSNGSMHSSYGISDRLWHTIRLYLGW